MEYRRFDIRTKEVFDKVFRLQVEVLEDLLMKLEVMKSGIENEEERAKIDELYQLIWRAHNLQYDLKVRFDELNEIQREIERRVSECVGKENAQTGRFVAGGDT